MALVRHIVIWRFKEGFSSGENRENAQRVKRELENLKSVIPGIVEIGVHIDPLSSSNMNIVLNSVFENEAALETYRTHPAHVEAGKFVRAVTQDRACIDYVE